MYNNLKWKKKYQKTINNKMEIEKYMRSNGIRVELDFTEDDDGIFLWNANGYIDISETKDLIKTLQIAVNKVETNRLKYLEDNK